MTEEKMDAIQRHKICNRVLDKAKLKVAIAKTHLLNWLYFELLNFGEKQQIKRKTEKSWSACYDESKIEKFLQRMEEVLNIVIALDFSHQSTYPARTILF